MKNGMQRFFVPLLLAALVMIPGVVWSGPSTVAYQSAIRIVVDGEPLQLDVAPVEVNGRVLVPLRGIFERLGADVKFEAATQTIRANRGEITVEMQIGSRYASVNGSTVTLDVPPTMMQGRTMVPLRFVSQALGANVHWDSYGRLVSIATGGTPAPTSTPTPAPTPTTQGAPVIRSFTHNATGSLRAGDQIEMTLVGDAGGSASFDITGLVTGVPMPEVLPGTYRTSYVIPQWAAVQAAPVYGHLSRNGIAAPVVVAAAPLTVSGSSATGTLLRTLTPSANSVVTTARPTISAAFNTEVVGAVDSGSVRLLVNGQDVTDNATFALVALGAGAIAAIMYTPSQDLPAGVETVLISGRAGGRSLQQQWSFTVQPIAAAAFITSVTPSATGSLPAGYVLTVTLVGSPGGRATFDLGAYRSSLPMDETAVPGTYQGAYTVRSGDQAANLPVIGRLRLSGQQATLQAATTVTLAGPGGPIAPPQGLSVVFTAPVEGATVPPQMEVKGMTQAGATVTLSMQQYIEIIPGVVGYNQAVGAVTAQADGNGRFTAQFTVQNPISGSRLEVTAVAKDATGAQGSEAKLTLNLQ